jgi:hypothetical protein
MGGISSDAIMGLVGVLTGSVVTGGFQLALAARIDHRDARAARRLVRSELGAYEAALAYLAENGTWLPPLREELLNRSQWTANSDRLARDLPVNVWKRIDFVYWDQATFVERIEGNPARLQAQTLLDHVRAAISDLDQLDQRRPLLRLWTGRRPALQPNDQN